MVKFGIKGNSAVIDGDSVTIQNIPFATSAEIDLYIRASDGSDSNPGTSSLPLATLIEAENRIPLNVEHAVRLHVGPHTGNGYDKPYFRPRNMRANIYLIGDGGGGSSDGFIEILSSTAALSGSDNTKIVSSGLSTTEFGGFGEYWGATIEILSGDAAGDRRIILYNTATDIVPNHNFSASVALNDTYRIVKPAINIIYTNPYSIFANNCGNSGVLALHDDNDRKGLWIINLNFYTTNDNIFRANNSAIFMMGVTGDADFQLSGLNNLILSGLEILNYSDGFVSSPVVDLGVDNNKSWLGWGLSLRHPTTRGNLLVYGYNQLSGSINCKYLQVLPYTKIYLHTGSIWGANAGIALLCYHLSYVEIDASTDTNKIRIGSLSSTTNAVKTMGYMYVAGYTSTSNSLLIRSSGNCIESSDGGVIQLNDFSVNAIKIESGSGIGMVTKKGGKIFIGYNNPEMNCSGNDFSEDNGNSVNAIASLASGSIFSDVSHGIISRD